MQNIKRGPKLQYPTNIKIQTDRTELKKFPGIEQPGESWRPVVGSWPVPNWIRHSTAPTPNFKVFKNFKIWQKMSRLSQDSCRFSVQLRVASQQGVGPNAGDQEYPQRFIVAEEDVLGSIHITVHHCCTVSTLVRLCLHQDCIWRVRSCCRSCCV